MKRALISVSDKTGVVELAKNLSELGYEILSTGGTYTKIKENNISVTSVDSVTGFQECLDGRVKTLHPHIHGGILALRDNEEHMNHLKELSIKPIDIVVVNLYPFKETILKPGVSLDEAIENIDIGGPSMVRAAAKNYQFVSVITDIHDYDKIIEEIKEYGDTTAETKFYLTAKAFMHTAQYDALIADYLKKKAGMDIFDESITLTYEKAQDMRYGENPHQKAAFYKEIGNSEGLLTNAVQLHGKELSFNNINDAHGALELLKEFEEPTLVACKHSNPCGVGTGKTIAEAYKKAYACDPTSIFGGILAANRTIDKEAAEEINKCFIEIVIAPDYTEEAIGILTQKKNIRLMKLPEIAVKQPIGSLDIKKVSGGILVQEVNNELLNQEDLKVVSDREPTEKEMKDLIFAWKTVKHTKSNSITICKDGMTLGLGIGQVSRIWACEQAIDHAKQHSGEESLYGAAMASDAYFPFPDCVEAAAKAGITAVIHPGGSKNDQLSIDLCNKYNMAMVLTGMRHFRH